MGRVFEVDRVTSLAVSKIAHSFSQMLFLCSELIFSVRTASENCEYKITHVNYDLKWRNKGREQFHGVPGNCFLFPQNRCKSNGSAGKTLTRLTLAAASFRFLPISTRLPIAKSIGWLLLIGLSESRRVAAFAAVIDGFA